MFTRIMFCCLIALNSVAYAGEQENLLKAQALPPTSTELKYSSGALRIKANYAWSRDMAGKGVVIGVLDTGVWGAHSEFDSRVLAGYDFVHDVALLAGANSDDNLHGTHVAGVIAANAGSGYVTGMAPDAHILPVKVLDAEGSGYLTDIADGLDYARLRGAQVINLSLGWSGGAYLSVQQALHRNVAVDSVIVVAAGNEGAANPSWPARYASQKWANGQIIAVGAVDANNRLASFSNKAGDAKYFYLVAPGVDVLSTIPSGIEGLSGSSPWYAYLSGTSMATPYVSGAVALLESYWPHLKAKDVASILFTTATDLGAKGVDNVYGRGLVNVEKAMQPVGKTKVPTKQGKKPTRTKMVASRMIRGRILAAADAGAFRTIMVDSYNRDYQIDLRDMIASEASLSLTQLFSGMDARLRYGVKQFGNGLQLAAAYTEEPGKITAQSFAIRRKFAGGEEFAFGTANFANTFLGLDGTPFSGLGLTGQSPLEAPYMQFAQAEAFSGYGVPLQNGWTLKTALMSGSRLGLNALSVDGFGMTSYERSGSSLMGVLEFTRDFEDGKFAMSAGHLRESDRLLGGAATGALAINGSVDSRYVMASSAYRLHPKLWLGGNISVGTTSASDLSGGMIAGISDTASLGWSISLLGEEALRKDDRLSFSISQPLSAISGSMRIDKAVGVNSDGSYRYARENLSLASSARETDFEIGYLASLSRRASLSAGLVYRLNPGNDGQAADEAMLGVRWQWLTY